MNESDFSKPSGIFQDNSDDVKTFLPDPLPPFIDSASIMGLAAEAHTQLGILAGIGSNIPNPNLLIEPYIRREAVLSSKIEGTQASIMDVFEFEAQKRSASDGHTGPRRVLEVVNYARALNDCLGQIGSGMEPSLEMIRRAHKTLLHNVRGQEKTPGEFRTVQNWIGSEGTAIEDAAYVPPTADMLDGLLLQMEGFLKNPTAGIPVLIQCALIHYQFEAIHPFADGNGRIGRLLIPLILADRGMLERPLLYLSEYFEKNRSQYYAHLLNVSRHSQWTEWIKFFLKGVIEQSQKATDNIKKIMALKSDYAQKLRRSKTSANVVRLTESLFASPAVTVTAAASELGVTYRSAKNIIDQLVGFGILRELGARKRNRIYVAQDIVNLFETP